MTRVIHKSLEVNMQETAQLPVSKAEYIEAGEARGFRFMSADGNSKCPYCGDKIHRKDLILGIDGIRWGHASCMIMAYDDHELIASPNKKRTRPEAMTARLVKRTLERRVIEDNAEKWPSLAAGDEAAMQEQRKAKVFHAGAYAGGKSAKYGTVTGRWSSKDANLMNQPKLDISQMDYSEHEKRVLAATITKHNLHILYDDDETVRQVLQEVWSNPPSEPLQGHCEDFEPVYIGPAFMPPSKRPNEAIIAQEEAWFRPLEDEWGKLIDDTLDIYKRRSKKEHRCNVHSGRWGLDDNYCLRNGLALNTSVQVGLEPEVVNESEWIRYLWLVCPGHPNGWDGKAGRVY